MRIVLLGAPGAGKGTQAKRLAQRFDMAHLSSGDILRAEKASGTEMGDKVAEYMDAGRLVPDDLVVDVMAAAIRDSRADGGLLLDGFPRTVAQAEALDAQLRRLNVPLDVVVVVEVDEGVVVERICGRRSCPECGEIYHEKYLRPKSEGVCDKCGYRGEFAQRDDDREDVVRRRLEAYRKLTTPLLAYYRESVPDKIISVDGGKGPDEVTDDLVARLEPCRS